MTAKLVITEHDQLGGLANDEHLQYLLLSGRSGGQSAVGGTGASEELALRGTSNANLGQIRIQSPIIIDDVSAALALNPYSIRDNASFTVTGGYVGGVFADQRTITFQNSTFIYETLRASPAITSGVNPAFAAFTLFNALPVLAAGSGANQNILQALVLNAGVQFRNFTGLARTSPGGSAVSWAPNLTTNGGVAGSTITLTNTTGLRNAPVWNTRSGTTVNFGTIRGLHCLNPAQALFGASAGIETMSAYYAVDVEAIPFGGNLPKAALRSQITAASNAYFLNNVGGAQSEHGSAHIHFNDNFGILLGGTISGGSDVLIRHLSTVPNALDIYFPNTLDDMQISSPAADRFQITSNLFPGNEISFGFSRFAFGQTGAVGNQVGVFVAPARSTTVNGEWSDFLLTQAGNLTIDHTMGTVAAWTINAVSLTSGVGTLNGPMVTLNIGGMTTSGLGSAETHAIRVTGRTTFRGALAYEETTPTALAADVNDYQGQGLGNSMRQVIRVEASGAARTITGFDVQQSRDTIIVINIGATFNVVLAHQNAGSAASNRIISPTGANLTLGPDESAHLWHDPTTDRWRITYHTGT